MELWLLHFSMQYVLRAVEVITLLQYGKQLGVYNLDNFDWIHNLVGS